MRETPVASRLHIGIFGRRNAGKSSLINALTGQNAALVSGVPGTTTDPVSKTMEIQPIGPVVLIDTAGFDDTGELGRLRVERSLRVLRRTDLVIFVLDATVPPGEEEDDFITEVRTRGLPLVVALNKTDLAPGGAGAGYPAWAVERSLQVIPVSAVTGTGIGRLKQAVIAAAPEGWEGPPIIGDLLRAGDTVILVVPIDLEAPKGRLILPQVQTLRDILDHQGQAIVVKETQLEAALNLLGPPGPGHPRLVVTDSQAFGQVARLVPPGVGLTSFSILFARHKGDLATLVRGAHAVGSLRPGDPVLIAEACTHHPIGDDIGRVKIPRWLERKAGGPLAFTHVVGGDFPANLAEYKLVVHCGACMINRREMLHRLGVALAAGVPIVNYGVLIAHLHGILPRALEPFAATAPEPGTGYQAISGI